MDVAAIFASVVFAMSISAQWDTYLRFRYGGSFGVADPLFKVDLGFYFFRLPFYELLQGSLIFLTVAALAIVSGFVLLELQQSGRDQNFKIRPNTARHLAVLLFILSATFGWGFYLDHYELVYSTLGVVYGAGYTAAHVTNVVLWGMVGIRPWPVDSSRLRLSVHELSCWPQELAYTACCMLWEFWCYRNWFRLSSFDPAS